MRGLIAIALSLMLLLAASCSRAGDERAQKGNTGGDTNAGEINAETNADSNTAPPQQTTCDRCELLVPPGHFHEPPIGTGRGSFYLDIPARQYRLNTAQTPTDGYFVNTPSGSSPPNFQYIEKIAVLTEIGDSRGQVGSGSVIFETFDFTSEDDIRLYLWLSPYTNQGWPNNPIPEDALPDVIIDGSSGGSFKTKTPLEQRPAETGKKHRGLRYFGNERNKAVRKWAVVDRAGNVITRNGRQLTASGDDLYQIYVDMHSP